VSLASICILGGGLPARTCVLVTGDPGCGKTVLCSQVAFAHVRSGGRVVLATVTSESHEKVISGLRGFSFFEPQRLGEEVFLVSAYPSMKRGPDESRDMLLSSVRERNATLLFIDGLRAIRDLWRDEAVLRQFLYELNVGPRGARLHRADRHRVQPRRPLAAAGGHHARRNRPPVDVRAGLAAAAADTRS